MSRITFINFFISNKTAEHKTFGQEKSWFNFTGTVLCLTQAKPDKLDTKTQCHIQFPTPRSNSGQQQPHPHDPKPSLTEIPATFRRVCLKIVYIKYRLTIPRWILTLLSHIFILPAPTSYISSLTPLPTPTLLRRLHALSTTPGLPFPLVFCDKSIALMMSVARWNC